MGHDTNEVKPINANNIVHQSMKEIKSEELISILAMMVRNYANKKQLG